jgi:hypothetical protein
MKLGAEIYCERACLRRDMLGGHRRLKHRLRCFGSSCNTEYSDGSAVGVSDMQVVRTPPHSLFWR